MLGVNEIVRRQPPYITLHILETMLKSLAAGPEIWNPVKVTGAVPVLGDLKGLIGGITGPLKLGE